MPNWLHLTILTPAKVLVDIAAVIKVRLKLADDMWLSIYPHHLPLIAETLVGPVTYTTTIEGETALPLAPGIVHIANNAVTLFTSGGAELQAEMETASSAVTAQEFERLAQALFTTLGAQVEPDTPA